jgi:hypothetical protein
MLEIGKSIVSLDLINACFTCDLNACKGMCCVTGDSGAPLESGEAKILEEIFPLLRPYLSEVSIRNIEAQGTSVIDIEQDTVTPLNDGMECSYVTFIDGIAFCAIEKAYLQGVISFRKPVSCYLYPVRIKKYSRFDAVNYDRWDVCHDAVHLGEKLNMPVYQYVKDPLVQKYGPEWFNLLEVAARNLAIENDF